MKGRLVKRHANCCEPDLVQSQFEDREKPTDAFSSSAGPSMEEIVKTIQEKLNETKIR